MALTTLLPLSLVLVATAQALATAAPCPPLLGGGFPAPSAPSTSQTIQHAQQSFSSLLQDSLTTGNTPYGALDNLTSSFSVSIFSAHESTPLYTYHYAAPGLNGSLTSGALNDETIYRIGSVSKLLTLYTLLIEAGEDVLDQPITKYIPELAALDNSICKRSKISCRLSDPVRNYAWSDITLGALASHMAGVVRDVNLGDLSAQGIDLTAMGLPPLPSSQIPTCQANPLQPSCSRQDIFNGLKTSTPMGLSYHTPEYSNIGYVLLAYALEGITKKPFQTSFDAQLVHGLNLTRTSLHAPVNKDNVIIPIDDATSMFSWDLGVAAPVGGVYSTIADLTTIGRSILQSKLLSPTLTRRWLKPVTHTSSLYSSIGYVWEIVRLTIPISENSNVTRVVDLYTKTGNFGAYSSIVVLDPEHDLGFTIISAGQNSGQQVNVLSDLISKTWVAAMEEAAREQAQTNFVGTYESTDSSLNTTLSLTLSPDVGGLVISSLISNSSDAMVTIAGLKGAQPGQEVSGSLYSTGLTSKTKISFRASFEVLPRESTDGAFSMSSTCASWAMVGSLTYGNIALDDFVFNLDGTTGKAVSVIPRILRATLKRKES